MTQTATASSGGRMRTLLRPFRTLIQEVGKFGVVGLIAFVVDVGLFNLLMYAGNPGILADKPLTAKGIAVIAATTVSFALNRNWTFSQRGGRSTVTREYLLFFLFNGIAMCIALACLWFSHYALGLTSPLADNISANGIGLVLGTLFRFWAYRTYVFPAVAEEDSEDAPATSAL